MILAIGYTVKSARKGYKKYQAKKLEKEEATKGTLPALEDPSRELGVGYQAERSATMSTDDSSSRRSSSESTKEAEKALENDPEFQKYMQQQRSLYLSKTRGLPPAYDATDAKVEMPTVQSPTQYTQSPTHSYSRQVSSPTQSMSAVSSNSNYSTRQNSTPISATSSSCCVRDVTAHEMPAPMTPIVELEVPDIKVNKAPIAQLENDGLVLCEMPGDMPAIWPEKRSRSAVELPASS